MTTTPGQIARRAFYEAMIGRASSEALWEAAAAAVVEMCAQVADPLCDSASDHEAGAAIHIAEGIRALKVGE